MIATKKRKTMKIRYAASTRDSSGYGEFARYFIKVLHQAGHEVCVDPIIINPKPNSIFGDKGRICESLEKKVRRPDINIVNMIPTFFKQHKLPSCKNVGFTMWETTKVPESWVKACNQMDAIFVPCTWNAKTFKESGVRVPIHVVFPGMDPDDVPDQVAPEEKAQDKFQFYSVFQWLERKNPVGLLRAYFAEFQGVEDVRLVLKTYMFAKAPNNAQLISEQINKVQQDMRLKEIPEVQVLADFLSHEQMHQLHRQSHCFVLPHRSEGFGMPHMDSMSYGNPTIATNFSGNVDFMNSDNSYVLPYQICPTFGMPSFIPWYDGTQSWADADLNALRRAMRNVYENRQEAFAKGAIGRKYILDNFNPDKSVSSFVGACEKVRGN